MSKNLDILGMSDDEFAKLSGPPEAPAATEEKPVVEEPAKVEEPVEPAATTPAQETEEPPAVEEPEAASEPEAEKEPEVPAGSAIPVPEKEKPVADPPEKPVEKPIPESAEKPAEKKPEPKAEKSAADYKAFFERVMAPFKANGKLVQLESPDEVIQLMQMGANYTRKMQELSKSRKFVMMLENNQLLDENKLSFLIDLDKKNPEAIKKLLKDAKIDPVEIDTSEEPQYQGGAHRVSDQEAALAAAIEDLKGQNGGLETLKVVNAWDQASKKWLWESPEVIAIIHEQRESGVYAQIAAEIDRWMALGKIPANVPFLQAYKTIGDEMQARGALTPAKPAGQAPAAVPGRTPVAVRPAKVPATTVDNPKVKAAAPPKNAAAKAKVVVNPLAMSDEEFQKIYG